MALELFSLLLCVTWGVLVAIRDLSTYQIPNSSIFCGVVLLWPAFYFLNLRVHFNLVLLLILISVFVLGFTSLIGMGDAKLTLLLAPWLHQSSLDITFSLVIGISWLQLITISLIHRRLPKRIAFAPAILLAAAHNMAT